MFSLLEPFEVNTTYEFFFTGGTHDDALSRKCQEFALSDVLCTCLKDRDTNDALKAAIHVCKEEAKKTEPEAKPTSTSVTEPEAKKSKRQAKEEPQEPSEHSQVKKSVLRDISMKRFFEYFIGCNKNC